MLTTTIIPVMKIVYSGRYGHTLNPRGRGFDLEAPEASAKRAPAPGLSGSGTKICVRNAYVVGCGSQFTDLPHHRRRRHTAGGGRCPPPPNFWYQGHGEQQNLQGTCKKLIRLVKKPNIQQRKCSACHPWQLTHCHSSTALSITLCFMSAQTAVRHRFSSSTSCIAVW